MVSIQDRIFLIAGLTSAQRQRALATIKARVPQKAFEPTNTLTLYSKETDLKTFQEKLSTFSFGRDKLVFIKQCDSLKKEERAFFADNIKTLMNDTALVFETDSPIEKLRGTKKNETDPLFKLLLTKATIFKASVKTAPATIESFRMSLRRNDLAGAVYSLQALLPNASKERELGPLLLGILIGNVSRYRNSYHRKECFKYLWETDRAMKERGLSARLVLTTLLVKLLSA